MDRESSHKYVSNSCKFPNQIILPMIQRYDGFNPIFYEEIYQFVVILDSLGVYIVNSTVWEDASPGEGKPVCSCLN